MEDFIILGAGIVGLSCALALAPSGKKILILDRQRPRDTLNDDFDLRVYALTRQSQLFLARLGVWQQCRRVTPYRDMHVWENQASIHFDCREVAEPNLGHIVEHQVLVAALFQRLKDFKNITFEQIQSCQSISQTETVLLTADDKPIATHCLIAADGARSWCRETLDIPVIKWSYEQTALVATITVEKSHQHTAWQRFLSTGPLGLLPLPDPHKLSIVWSCDNECAEEYLALESQAFMDSLSALISPQLGGVTAVSERLHFPLQMQHAKRYTEKRVVLVGDAIHTIHPLAGQGLNLGLTDVMVLVNSLTGVDVSPRVLRRYERQRKSDNWKMIALMEAFKQLFSQQNSALQSIRQFGLNQCNDSQWIKQFFIRQAQGSEYVT